MNRILLVAFISLSSVQAFAHWSDSLAQAGFRGQTLRLQDPRSKSSRELFLVREVPYLPKSVPGWPNMTDEFSHKLLEMSAQVRFALAFIAPVDDPSSGSSTNAILLTTDEGNHSWSHKRPILILTANAKVRTLIHEHRHLKDGRLEFPAKISNDLKVLDFKPEEVGLLVDFIMEFRAYSEGFSADPALGPIDVFMANFLLPTTRILSAHNPTERLRFYTLLKSYTTDLQPNVFQQETLEIFGNECAALLRASSQR